MFASAENGSVLGTVTGFATDRWKTDKKFKSGLQTQAELQIYYNFNNSALSDYRE